MKRIARYLLPGRVTFLDQTRYYALCRVLRVQSITQLLAKGVVLLPERKRLKHGRVPLILEGLKIINHLMTKLTRYDLTLIVTYFPFILLQPRKKSKAEVMAEVMAKSKEHKVCILSPLRK